MLMSHVKEDIYTPNIIYYCTQNGTYIQASNNTGSNPIPKDTGRMLDVVI